MTLTSRRPTAKWPWGLSLTLVAIARTQERQVQHGLCASSSDGMFGEGRSVWQGPATYAIDVIIS